MGNNQQNASTKKGMKIIIIVVSILLVAAIGVIGFLLGKSGKPADKETTSAPALTAGTTAAENNQNDTFLNKKEINNALNELYYYTAEYANAELGINKPAIWLEALNEENESWLKDVFSNYENGVKVNPDGNQTVKMKFGSEIVECKLLADTFKGDTELDFAVTPIGSSDAVYNYLKTNGQFYDKDLEFSIYFPKGVLLYANGSEVEDVTLTYQRTGVYKPDSPLSSLSLYYLEEFYDSSNPDDASKAIKRGEYALNSNCKEAITFQDTTGESYSVKSSDYNYPGWEEEFKIGDFLSSFINNESEINAATVVIPDGFFITTSGQPLYDVTVVES